MDRNWVQWEFYNLMHGLFVWFSDAADSPQFQETVRQLPDAAWTVAKRRSVYCLYKIPPNLSMAHVDGVRLVLEKWQGCMGLEWNISNDENSFNDFNEEAFLEIVNAQLDGNRKTVNFGIEAPTSCQDILLRGIIKFVKANSTTTCLQLEGEHGPYLDREDATTSEDPIFDQKYLSLLQNTLSAIEEKTSALETLTVSGFLLRLTCAHFWKLLSHALRGLDVRGGRVDLTHSELPSVFSVGIQELNLEYIYFTPETLSLLPSTLGHLVHLESLGICFYSCYNGDDEREKMALLEQNTAVHLLRELRVPKLSLHLELYDDYSLDGMFDALRTNSGVKDLSLDLHLNYSTHPFSDNVVEHLSPNGKDWLYYNQCRLFCKALEESNTTVQKVKLRGPSNPSSNAYKGHVYTEQLRESIRHWTALNHFGRSRIRNEENVCDVLTDVEKEMQEGTTAYCEFGFVSVAYGLLRECPTLWLSNLSY